MRTWQRLALNKMLRKENVKRLQCILTKNRNLQTFVKAAARTNVQQLRSGGILSNGAAKNYLRLTRNLSKQVGNRRQTIHTTSRNNIKRNANHSNNNSSSNSKNIQQKRKFSSSDGFGNFKPKNANQAKKQSKASGKNSNKKDNSKKDAGKGGAAASDKSSGGSNNSWAEGFRSLGNKAKDGAKGSSGSGKGEAPGPPGPNSEMQGLMTAGLSLAVMWAFFKGKDDHGEEINFQTFKSKLLARGEVERLIIVNKSTVKVVLRPDSTLNHGSFSGSSQQGQQPGGNRWGDNPATSGSGSSTDSGSDSSGGYYNSQRGEKNSMSRGYNGSNGSQSRRGGAPDRYFYFTIGSVEAFERKLEVFQRELGIDTQDFIPVQYVSETNWGSEFMRFSPTLLIIGFWLLLMRGMGGGGMGMGGGGGGGMNNIFKVGQSNAKKFAKDGKVDVSFKDVAGVDEAKREVMEFVQFLQDPSRFTKLGAKIPKGALLVGPPGTGKTLLAKATAGEASVPFFSISGSDFIEMFVGVGPSRVRDLFKQARENTPCIVFIDEIDAVARARGKGGFTGSNDERENTLNQLLVEMDGFSSTEGVVVLAGTNRADILDKAILRPGRFDRQITVDKPDIKGRKDIFEVHLQNMTLDSTAVHLARFIEDGMSYKDAKERAMDEEELSEPEVRTFFAQRLSALTPGFAGAEIANIVNEAAIIAAREAKDSIEMRDFEKASERVIGGIEKPNSIMTPKEKKTVAYHEAGHAIAGWFLEHADPLLKVTIVPRGSGALGFAQYLPKEVALHTKDQIVDMMCMALGGRAAEDLMFGKVTTGASDDLNRVTQMAYGMVRIYGMNENIGNVSFPPSEEMQFDKPYSDATAQMFDEEAKLIIQNAYKRTRDLLEDKKEALIAVAELLLEKETINQDDVIAAIGDRPFEMQENQKEFLRASFARFDQEEDKMKAAEKEKEDDDVVDDEVVDDEGETVEGDEELQRK